VRGWGGRRGSNGEKLLVQSIVYGKDALGGEDGKVKEEEVSK